MGVRESGSISGRLPDDPGGFTCMKQSKCISKTTGMMHPSDITLRNGSGAVVSLLALHYKGHWFDPPLLQSF